MEVHVKVWRQVLALALLLFSPCGAGLWGGQAGATLPAIDQSEELQRLKTELATASLPLAKNSDPSQVASCNLRRADILARIINRSPPPEQPALVQQMADCLGAAAEATPAEPSAYRRLVHLEEQVTQQRPGSDLAAYVTLLEIEVDFARKQASSGTEFIQALADCRSRLASYVKTYPRATQTAQVLLELGTMDESMGRDETAKQWYREAVKRSSGTETAFKAQGALRRLDLEGKYLFLDLPPLENTDPQPRTVIDIRQLRERVVIIYFWTSHDSRCQRDLHIIDGLLDRYRDQGLELISVNIDKNPDDGRAFLRSSPIKGLHAYQSGELDGPVTTRYGIMAVPAAFLVARTGKVARRNAEISNLEEAIKQQLK